MSKWETGQSYPDIELLPRIAAYFDATVDSLPGYERACRKLEFPLELHGDDFFDKLESWIEEASVTGTSAPRDEALLKKSLVDSVAANPAFAPLADEPCFKRIVASLEEIAR